MLYRLACTYSPYRPEIICMCRLLGLSYAWYYLEDMLLRKLVVCICHYLVYTCLCVAAQMRVFVSYYLEVVSAWVYMCICLHPLSSGRFNSRVDFFRPLRLSVIFSVEWLSERTVSPASIHISVWRIIHCILVLSIFLGCAVNWWGSAFMPI